MTPLKTERLLIREFTEEDAPFVLGLVNEPSWLRFIGDRDVHTIAEARTYLQTGALASYKQHGFGLYLVALKENLLPIGMCGFIKRPSLPDVDIGFAFLPQFTGQGYGFEAATAVLHYGQTTLGFKRILAITAVDNIRSINLLQKLGFHYEKLVQLSEDGEAIKLFALANS